VGAGGLDVVLGRAELDDRLLIQRGRRAGLDTGAAGHAFGAQEGLADAGADLGVEAAALDGEGEGALYLGAGAHAARADDALAGLEGEVGVALVLLGVEVVRAIKAVA